MKNFNHFGIKFKGISNCNYTAIWNNLITIRFGDKEIKELPADKAEFYDVSLGNRCHTGKCNFCYVSSNPNGEYYTNVCETWKKFIATFAPDKKEKNITITEKPFQIAIGSEGSADESPEFCDFLETVYNTGVVPNYTTNGVILSYYDKPGTEYYDLANKILKYTHDYVAGVAVSFGNKSLRSYAENAIKGLLEKGDCHINIHHIISDKASVQDFIDSWYNYSDDIKYHVLLPLMPSGRSTKGLESGVWEILEKAIKDLNITNVAFGAHFYKYLTDSSIKAWIYPPESLSKNMILKNGKVIITPSSFDLTPIKTFDFNEKI